MADGNQLPGDAEISASDLWHLLRSGWKAISAGVVLGLAAAAAAITLGPQKFEAVGTIRVGQVAQIEQVGAFHLYTTTPKPVEPAAQAAERITTARFQRRVDETLNGQARQQANQQPPSRVLSAKALQDAAEPNQDPLIEVRVQGETAEAAQRELQGVASQLAEIHAELTQVSQTRLRATLDLARARLANSETVQSNLTKMIQEAGTTADRATPELLLPYLRLERQAQIFDQRQAVIALEKALQAPATRPTQLIEGPSASPRRVFPRPAFLVLAGVVLGLLIGLLWALWSDRWHQARRHAAMPPTP